LITAVNVNARAAAVNDQALADAIRDAEPFRLLTLSNEFLATPESDGAQTNDPRNFQGGDVSSDLDPAFQPIQQLRRIKVTAQFEVPLASADVFMLDMAEPFIRNEMQRDDAPYTVVVKQDGEPWTTSGDGAGSGGTRGNQGGTRGPKPLPGATRPTGSSTGSGNLDQLAPIENPDNSRDNRTGSDAPQSSILTVEWYAVLDSMNDSTENTGDEP
jgi:hypothetical protein